MTQPLFPTTSFAPGELLVQESMGQYRLACKDEILQAAKQILEKMLLEKVLISNDTVAIQYLEQNIGDLEHEVFHVLFLDSQHKLIRSETMFRGTVNQSAVYPREIVKRCLQHNAVAVIFAHNHPSGLPEPSRADVNLTQTLIAALKLIDVRVLDHIVVALSKSVSMSARGLI